MTTKQTSTESKKIFIFAGERSGDLHGSHLVQALKSLHPGWHIEGVPGPSMRAQGVQSFLRMEDFEVMGLTDVLWALPKLYRQFYLIKNHILKTKPDCVILIDYPGFNLKLATHLRKSGFKGKIVQYISPTVWAWGTHRIKTLNNTLDLLLTIYPFEKKYFTDTSLPVEYVGNPLSEYIEKYQYHQTWKNQLNIPSNKQLIALFPGSRKSEIERNLPFMIEAAKRLHQEFPETIFAISNPTEKENLIPEGLKNIFFTVPKQYTYELMRASHLAIAKSGTVTLELALQGCPTIVIYKLTFLNRLYAKYYLKLSLPHYCIVNILAESEIFPELIKENFSIETLYFNLKKLYTDSPKRQQSLKGCEKIKSQLNSGVASKKAAESISRIL